MKEICNPFDCTGCMACYNACTHMAIRMVADEEGFLRPFVEDEKCVECELCRKICPANNKADKNIPLKIFSGWSKDEDVRLKSSSGGAFVEIAKPILRDGGVVFGCALNEKLTAYHTFVESLEDLKTKLSGSKYVQSDIGESFRHARKFLLQGRKVLFSGTPCQIAGLRNYLRKDYVNLLTIDIICHGVPSPMIFEDYKRYIEETEDMRISDVKFRCKKSSWIFFNMSILGHVEKTASLKRYDGCYYEDPYIRGFLRDYFLRPSCHQCHYASIERCSDFTIADWWGYRKTTSEDKDYAYKGVSLVMANTQKALDMQPVLSMNLRERTVQEAVRTNICLSRPFSLKDIRAEFWKDYRTIPFSAIVKKYMMPEKVRMDIYLRQHFKNTDQFLLMLKLMMLPNRAVSKVKRIIGL